MADAANHAWKVTYRSDFSEWIVATDGRTRSSSRPAGPGTIQLIDGSNATDCTLGLGCDHKVLDAAAARHARLAILGTAVADSYLLTAVTNVPHDVTHQTVAGRRAVCFTFRGRAAHRLFPANHDPLIPTVSHTVANCFDAQLGIEVLSELDGQTLTRATAIGTPTPADFVISANYSA